MTLKGDVLTSRCGIVAIITKIDANYAKAKIHGITFEARRKHGENGDEYFYFFGQTQDSPIWIKKGTNA